MVVVSLLSSGYAGLLELELEGSFGAGLDRLAAHDEWLEAPLLDRVADDLVDLRIAGEFRLGADVDDLAAGVHAERSGVVAVALVEARGLGLPAAASRRGWVSRRPAPSRRRAASWPRHRYPGAWSRCRRHRARHPARRLEHRPAHRPEHHRARHPARPWALRWRPSSRPGCPWACLRAGVSSSIGSSSSGTSSSSSSSTLPAGGGGRRRRWRRFLGVHLHEDEFDRGGVDARDGHLAGHPHEQDHRCRADDGDHACECQQLDPVGVDLCGAEVVFECHFGSLCSVPPPEHRAPQPEYRA